MKGIQLLDEMGDLSVSEVTICVDIDRRRVTKTGLQIETINLQNTHGLYSKR